MIDTIMTDSKPIQSAEAPVEVVLREELAHGDVVLGTISPILGHLLANHDHSLFSDEIVARVRGMVSSVAHQILAVQYATEDAADQEVSDRPRDGEEKLATLIADSPAFLTHCHALAIESHLAERLRVRNSIDPVLSPLLQSLIASDDPATASAAMATLAAQARFMRHQQRMELPLGELPADLFHHALLCWRNNLGESLSSHVVVATENRLRTDCEEGRSRLGLLSRMVSAMGNGARAGLNISHAGAALFLTTLALLSDQDREVAALSSNDRQLARLALALRGAGLNPKEVEEQFLYIHPEISLPDGFSELRVDRALAILASSSGWRVG